jgi:hypothetical protein
MPIRLRPTEAAKLSTHSKTVFKTLGGFSLPGVFACHLHVNTPVL